MSSGPGNIIIKIGADAAGAISGLNNVNKSLGDTMTTGQKATAGLRKAALPAAAALGAIGIAAIGATKAAAEDAAAQEKLAGQLSRVTGATDSQIAASEDYITKLSMSAAVADDELRPALGKLATATGDVGSAQDALAIALDVSAQTGKSLDSVTGALAKGYAGNTAAIGKLVPGMDAAVLKSKDMSKVTEELAQLTGGAAVEAAGTAEGQYKLYQIQMAELQETLGTALLPVMELVIGAMRKAATFAAEHTTAIKILVGAVAALAAGILIANGILKAYHAIQGIVTVATGVWNVAQKALNASMRANVIGIIITALALLVTGIIIAYQKSETFRTIVQGAMNAVKVAVQALGIAFKAVLDAAQTAFNWIRDHWKLALFALGPIGVALRLLIDNFDAVKNAGQTAFNVVKGAIDAVSGAIEAVIRAVERLLGAISRIKIPHIDLPGPLLAPVPAGAGVGVGARSSGAVATGGAGGTTINVYGAIDPEGTARAIERVLRSHNRRQGRR